MAAFDMDNSDVIENLRTLHDISKAMNSTLDMDDVVETIMEKTSALMGSGRALLLLLDKSNGTLRVREDAAHKLLVKHSRANHKKPGEMAGIIIEGEKILNAEKEK